MATAGDLSALFERFGVAWSRVVEFANGPVAARIPPAVRAKLPELLARAADPATALTNLERLVELEPHALEEYYEQAWWVDLITLLGASPSLANWLASQGAEWVRAFTDARQAPRLSAAQHVDRLASIVTLPWGEFADALRRYRHREYLRIGLHDLVHDYSVETTWTELSELAQGVVECAYRWARCRLEGDYGPLLDGSGRLAPFVVLGMGKLGGGELNFSSDIDLVYLYECDASQSQGGPQGTLDARAYFTRLAEGLTRALQEVTSCGFAFRVDLRLRPDGVNGPLVNSVSNALLYYESYGQTWERTALLKARPISGVLELGERFLYEVRPFVFRRYLDFATLADMQRMKGQIEAQLVRKGDEYNVKLGRGGIREIEFLVQTMQIVHGGRDERVRCRPTLEALERLATCRYLPSDDARALADAYRFLRDVEHKLQIETQRQTHTLPEAPLKQEILARRLGYSGEVARDEFRRELGRHTASVRAAFEKLFFRPESERRAQVAEAEERIVAALDNRDAATSLLADLGFQSPEQSYEHLLFLRDGPPSAPSSPRRRKVLFELLPSLLSAMRQSPHPDLALQNMASFLAAVGARTSFLMLLRENPGTMRMLVRVFATSQYLANQFIRHPELLDSLVRADLVRVRRPRAELAADLASLLAAAEDLEGKLDALRRFRNQEFLRIGINCVEDLLGDEEVGEELTNLAEVCLQASLQVAADQTLARFELPELPGRLVVLGLGKFGARELSFNSDLDLIFVYDPQALPGVGPTPHEIFTWLAQRLITVLQVPTKEGIVYRIDTRLRPSGHSGPLVSSLAAFRSYHEQSAQVWERQALIKARPVGGDAGLAQEVSAVVEQFVYRTPLSTEETREIRRLRGRMERELAREGTDHVNIKTGRGGLVDIEFLVQMLQLHCGIFHTRLRQRATLQALQVLADLHILPGDDAQVLTGGYRFLRRLEQTLRLLHDRPVEDLERHDVDLFVVARRLGFASRSDPAQALWQEYVSRRERIRELYERWFDRAEHGEIDCRAHSR
ncbi:MAG: bifunctional [glutamate--ammonia ligase]-adenylyl-L-tyrosine phosphorylase/[glutamate--ammonia-ligase] adenylyltransferase [Candidatus Binatia bacterium]|nr:bifunctional [glutamate--ammonia ligase]-adenylyl-L-tyrosine phosphorylase/[glutamate--ammonia-ligase] adenylyltransferase [Candidatus Binatia bacterium]